MKPLSAASLFFLAFLALVITPTYGGFFRFHVPSLSTKLTCSSRIKELAVRGVVAHGTAQILFEGFPFGTAFNEADIPFFVQPLENGVYSLQSKEVSIAKGKGFAGIIRLNRKALTLTLNLQVFAKDDLSGREVELTTQLDLFDTRDALTPYEFRDVNRLMGKSTELGAYLNEILKSLKVYIERREDGNLGLYVNTRIKPSRIAFNGPELGPKP